MVEPDGAICRYNSRETKKGRRNGAPGLWAPSRKSILKSCEELLRQRPLLEAAAAQKADRSWKAENAITYQKAVNGLECLGWHFFHPGS